MKRKSPPDPSGPSMDGVGDAMPPKSLTQSEIFELYCRLMDLEKRLGEIDALAGSMRPPLSDGAT